MLLFLSAALLGICVGYITDATIARDVVVLYTVTLCATLWLSRKNVIGVGSLLFTAGVVVALVINVRTPPLTSRIVTGWLKHELKVGMTRSAVLAVLAKHRAVRYTVTTHPYYAISYLMLVDYQNYTQILTCYPYPEIIFEFDRTYHLTGHTVQDVQTCT